MQKSVYQKSVEILNRAQAVAIAKMKAEAANKVQTLDQYLAQNPKLLQK